MMDSLTEVSKVICRAIDVRYFTDLLKAIEKVISIACDRSSTAGTNIKHSFGSGSKTLSTLQAIRAIF